MPHQLAVYSDSDSRKGYYQQIIQPLASGITVERVETHYTLDKDFSAENLSALAQALTQPVSERYWLDQADFPPNFSLAIEIGFMPGVTDNLATTVRETITDTTQQTFDFPQENVYSSEVLYLCGTAPNQLKPVLDALHNPIIQRVAHFSAENLRNHGFPLVIPKVKLQHEPQALEVSLEVADEELNQIGSQGIPNPDGSRSGPLALRPSYMKEIQAHFRVLGRAPTDIELESIAQTWSEHCRHTIFADAIDEDIPEGLFKTFIQRATTEIRRKKGAKDFCVSVFSDNSGGIAFDDDWVVTDKVETHNSPSALDPFGGAITGIVGVYRDALGYGLGAKPIMGRYGFCFGNVDRPPELFRGKNNPILSPTTIMKGVIAGVRAGGNESGVPTSQGFVHFDDCFNGKPLVFVGVTGLIPRTVKNQSSAEKCAQAGDHILVAGGRVGLDGIHGATFSSEALNEGSPSTAVQIGDPITQKKLLDAVVREARDQGLFTSITDNGAGGISCSIPEMAREAGGCRVDLDQVPLKYPNLAPWEIWVSESQERMTFAVPADKVATFQKLLASRGVESADLGTFNDSGTCQVFFRGKMVMDLSLEFMFEGIPAEALKTSHAPVESDSEDLLPPTDWNQELLTLLGRRNIGSFAGISQQYDHTVQAGAVIGPLQGVGKVNGTAAVTRPRLDSPRAVVTSQALNPRYSRLNTYAMTTLTIDQAIASAVAVGADVDQLAIMDNYCWCSGNQPERLAQLKASAQALYDTALAYGTPIISGKDSMFNDFRGLDKDENPVMISVDPTLLVSVLGVIPEATNTATMDWKQSGDLIYLLGSTAAGLGGSEYLAEKGKNGTTLPQLDKTSALERYQKVFQAHQQGMLASSLAVEKGGLAVALAKASIAGQKGVEVEFSAENLRPEAMLFGESPSRLLVSIAPVDQSAFESLMGSDAQLIGTVTEDSWQLSLGKASLELSLEDLTKAYQAPNEIFL